MRIVFMGTPEFAIPSLRVLHENGHEIVAVVTAPDRPSGRGQTLQASPVKEFALAQGLKVLQPEKLRDPAFVGEMAALNADLAVVVAFRMLPGSVWSLPRLGTLNLHASLLPDYRGAAPLNWAIINGETRTGATTFLIDREIDTGAILMQTKLDIPPHWNVGNLHDEMMERGAKLVLDTVTSLEIGHLKPQPQDESLARHVAPKLFKENCRIDWLKPAAQIRNLVRGLSPYPAAWTTLNGRVLKVYKASTAEKNENGRPGSIWRDNGGNMFVNCGEGSLRIEELQLEGKKRMETAAFLLGYKEILKHVE